MGWGSFGGGFSQGFGGGLAMGKMLEKGMKEKEVENVRKKGMAEAQAARDSDVNKMVQDGGITGEPATAKGPDKVPAPKTGEVAPDTATTKTQAVMPPATTTIEQAPVAPAAPPAGIPEPPTATPPVTAPTTPPVAAGGMTPATAKPVEIAPITVKPAVEAPAPAPIAAPVPEKPSVKDAAPVSPTPKPVAANGTGFKRFRVGDASFDTREEAVAYANKKAPSTNDYFMKNVVPKISQKYLEQGDIEKAEAWDKYSKEKTTQRNMETWGKMARAAQAGDMDAAANHAFELYKSYDDGVTPMGKETVKDKDGNVTGFNVKLKNDATGEVRQQFIGQREITEMGLSALSPQAMFDKSFARQQAVDAARAKAAADAANDQRTLNRELTVQGVRDAAADKRQSKQFDQQKEIKKMEGDQAIERVTIQEQMKAAGLGKAEEAKVNVKIKGLKDAGYTDDAINGMMPQILGVGDHKKTTDPTERRALVYDGLLKNDRAFAMEKDPAKREAKVNEAMRIIGGTTTGPNPVAPNPAAGGMPAKAQLFKGPDGKVYKLEGGRYIPAQ